MKKIVTGKIHIILGLMILFSTMMLLAEKPAYAATKVKISSVDYYNENIVIANGSNTKFYFALDIEAAKDDWDVMPADNGTYTTIDISWVSPIAEGVIFIKGNADTEPVRIVINKRPEKLNVSINYTNMEALPAATSIASLLNIQTTEGTAADPIKYDDLEWKKGEQGSWTNVNSLNVGLLEKYLIRGTYLYFRIAAVNDIASGTYTPDGTKGNRFSNAVKVKIEKQKAAMVYGIDGEKFTAAIKYGKEYRVTVTYQGVNNTPAVKAYSNWIQITDRSSDPILLATLANNVTPRKYDTNNNLIVYNGETVGFPQMLIEVRDYATKNAASSKTTEIPLNAQRTITKPIVPGTPALDAIAKGDDNVYVAYNGGNKYLTITIPTATATLPYEYTIVKPGYNFDIKHASWASITKGSGVKVLSTKALDGGKLYIRMKEIKSKPESAVSSAVAYALASTYVTFDINYPSIPENTKANLTYVKGYPTPLVIYATLNESGKVPFETEVDSVKLGTKVIGFTSEMGTSSTDPKVKMLKITLNGDDVKLLANCSNRVLTITYKNKTADKSSKLTIKSPTAAGALFATAAKGKTAGTTAITMSSTVGSGNTYVYIITTTEVTGKNMEDTIAAGTYTTLAPGTDITIAKDSCITIYEISSASTGNATSNIINYKCIKITSDFIG